MLETNYKKQKQAIEAFELGGLKFKDVFDTNSALAREAFPDFFSDQFVTNLQGDQYDNDQKVALAQTLFLLSFYKEMIPDTKTGLLGILEAAKENPFIRTPELPEEWLQAEPWTEVLERINILDVYNFLKDSVLLILAKDTNGILSVSPEVYQSEDGQLDPERLVAILELTFGEEMSDSDAESFATFYLAGVLANNFDLVAEGIYKLAQVLDTRPKNEILVAQTVTD